MQRYQANTFMRILPLLVAIAAGGTDAVLSILTNSTQQFGTGYMLGAVIGVLLRLIIVGLLPLLFLIGSSARRRHRRGFMITIGTLALVSSVIAILLNFIPVFNMYFFALFGGSTLLISLQYQWLLGIVINAVYLLNKLLLVIFSFTVAGKARSDSMMMQSPNVMQPPYPRY